MADIIVIGAGASGLACAISIAQTGPHKVTLLERQNRIGKKLLVAGNGRCNLGNTHISPEKYTSSDPELLAVILKSMSVAMLQDFWTSIGLLCRTESDSGRTYPATFQASTVVDTLLQALEQYRIRVVCDCRVSSIGRDGERFCVTAKAGHTYYSDKVVIACGGSAAPSLGTDGAAFDLCRNLGHSILPTSPGLSALRCRAQGMNALKGIRVKATASLFHDSCLIAEIPGEVQLTDYGLSGIPAMELANRIPAGEAKNCRVSLDLIPEWTQQELQEYLMGRCESVSNLTGENLLIGLIQKRIASQLLKQCDISIHDRCEDLTQKQLRSVARILKNWSFPVSEVVGWEKAQCTCGGVPLSEIDPVTMESKCAPGIYLTGETLDAAGDCGGYNLHWATCSGLLAAQSICDLYD